MRDNDSHVAFFSSAITLHWLLTTPMQGSLLPSQMKVEGLSFALLIFLSNPLVPHLISSKHFRYMGFFAIEPSRDLMNSENKPQYFKPYKNLHLQVSYEKHSTLGGKISSILSYPSIPHFFFLSLFDKIEFNPMCPQSV